MAATAPSMIPALDPAACLATGCQAAPDLPLRLLVVLGLAAVACWAAAKAPFPGKRAFFGLNVVLVGWILGSTAEHAAALPACKGGIALLAWPLVLALPVLWTLFLHQYVRRDHAPPAARWWVPTVAVLALLSLAVLANGAHGRFYTDESRLGPVLAGLPRMHYGRGPLFLAAAAWGYAWLVAATAIIVRAVHDCAPEDRLQWAAFLVMMCVPWAANVAFLGFGVRLAGADPTPLSFAVAMVGFAWMMRRSSLLRVVPMSRRLLFTELLDPVLVLDSADRVVDCNVAGRTLAGGRVPGEPALPGPLPLGAPLAAWPVFGAALAPLVAHGGTLHLAAPAMVFDVQVRVLGRDGARIGRLVQLRDVTERHRATTRHEAELRELARRDPLTGLPNRRALAERFDAEHAHQRSTGSALALVLVDVDHFKRINDRFGHAEGDRVLQALAQAVAQGLRASDAVFRIGGEEFALLMPGADGPQALARVQALHASLGVRTPDGAAVTFSAGVAACADASASLDALLHQADEALYRAKAAGRARSLAWEPVA